MANASKAPAPLRPPANRRTRAARPWRLSIAAVSAAAAAILAVVAPGARGGAEPVSIASEAAASPLDRAPVPKPLPDGLELPVYTAGPVPFRDGVRLVYRASWIGIPAAQARIEVRHDTEQPNLFKGEAWLRTNRFVDIFFRMRDYLTEEFDRASLEPRSMYIRQHENRRLNEYRVRFDREAEVVTAVKENHKGIKTWRFAARNPFGPISATIMALTQPLEPGQRLVFDVFTGNHRYVLDFRIIRRERIRTAMGSFDALRIIPGVVYLSKGSLRKKARGTIVWISDDQRRLPLRIEAAAFIGTVRADLVRVEPIGTAVAGDQVPARPAPVRSRAGGGG